MGEPVRRGGLLSPRRWLVCSACDGSKRGENGDICYECQGLGGSWYGENRPLRDIEIDLDSTRCILETDEAELERALQNLDRCKPEQVATYRKQVKLVEEQICYWRAQIDGLEVEREAALKRKGPDDAIRL